MGKVSCIVPCRRETRSSLAERPGIIIRGRSNIVAPCPGATVIRVGGLCEDDMTLLVSHDLDRVELRTMDIVSFSVVYDCSLMLGY